MTQIEELRIEISRSINTLRVRYASSTDDAEKQAIMAAIESLNGKLSLLNQASLLDAASILADATSDLEKAVAAARVGPFDGYLAGIEEQINRLHRLSGEIHGREALPRTPEKRTVSAPIRERATATPPQTIGGLPPPMANKDYAVLRDEYRQLFDACKVRPGNEGNVAYYVKRLNQGRPAYAKVGADLGGIPWAFIGIIHGMECGFNFAGHLHNGDPLTARTVQVPAGRPPTGTPPFTWQQSAADALTMKGYHKVTDWSVPHMLYLQEKYNGFGYRMRRLATPYLWSFSNNYTKGKFVQDGKFDPNAVSKQCGAALMLKAVLS